eukprot:gene14308-19192_t
MGLEELFINVKTLPDDSYGFIQLLFLGTVYGYIIMQGSNYISEGSELLLLVPSLSGIVGSLVLPVFGSIPDGLIILFSGLGPNAQEQLSVGMGSLAGSTVLLLTIPWFVSIYTGRVNIDKLNQPKYTVPKLIPPNNLSLQHTGVKLSYSIKSGAYILILSSLTYLVIQIPGLLYIHKPLTYQAAMEKNWALAGAIVCFLGFFIYCYHQYNQTDANGVSELTREEYLRESIQEGKISLLGVMIEEFKLFQNQSTTRARPNITTGYQSINSEENKHNNNNNNPNDIFSQSIDLPDELLNRLERILKPFFKAYDFDNNNCLDIHELSAVFNDLGESVSGRELTNLFNSMDEDKNSVIDYQEFVRGVTNYIYTHSELVDKHEDKYANQSKTKEMKLFKSFSQKQILKNNGQDNTIPDTSLIHDYDEEESNGFKDDDYHVVGENSSVGSKEEEEDIPEDIKNLHPDEQQRRIKMKSLYSILVGTFILLLFTDAMVEVIAEVGVRTNIPAFYVAFVLAPLMSNTLEIVSSYKYASKKTVTGMTISFGSLQGAIIMNNTFVLGIFLFLIYYQNLTWEYYAETFAILFVQLVTGYLSLRSIHTILDGLIIFAMYPASLILVAMLEKYGWN